MSDPDRLISSITSLAETLKGLRRTILCEPDRMETIRAAVEAAGVSEIITVKAFPACPQGQLLLVNTTDTETESLLPRRSPERATGRP